MHRLHRREMIVKTGAALAGLSAFPLGWARAAEGKKFKVLYFTRSRGFEHSVVHRPKKGELSYSEKLMIEEGKKHGVEVVCSKDGRVFDGDLDQFDAFAFYTSGVLTEPLPDKNRDEPPMSEKGLERLLQAIADGKGFVGFHAASDSFHSHGDKLTPYIEMIGGEFLTHGSQQKATMKITSPDFPGVKGLSDFALLEEWYASKNFAKDLHVILVQETAGMHDACYQRPPFPATWARMHGKGRVFYTSLGHREDIWTNPVCQQVILGGFAWILKQADFDPKPNIAEVTPKANQLKN